MTRPRFEIADIIRRADAHITSRHREYLTWPQVKVLNAILRCRTAALGGHREWLAARQRELLPVITTIWFSACGMRWFR